MWKYLSGLVFLVVLLNRSKIIMSIRRSGPRWNKMLPQTQQKADALVLLAKANGLDVMFYDGWRSPEDVMENLKAGTSKITDPYGSLHTWGVAFDIVFVDPTTGGPSWLTDNDPRWIKLAKLGESIGLKSGGLMWGWDYPHFQMPGYSSNNFKRQYGNNYDMFLAQNGVKDVSV